MARKIKKATSTTMSRPPARERNGRQGSDVRTGNDGPSGARRRRRRDRGAGSAAGLGGACAGAGARLGQGGDGAEEPLAGAAHLGGGPGIFGVERAALLALLDELADRLRGGLEQLARARVH